MKNQIIEISLQGFLRHGIRKMTIQRLVAPLGISTKTVYKFFTDKEDLLKHCLIHHYAALATEFENLVDSNQSDPLTALRIIWYKAFETDFGVNKVFYKELNLYYSKLQDTILNKVFKKNAPVLENLVTLGIEKKIFRKEIQPKAAIHTISLLYAALTRTDQYQKCGLSGDDLLMNTVDVYLRGICTEKGLKFLNQQKT